VQEKQEGDDGLGFSSDRISSTHLQILGFQQPEFIIDSPSQVR
jgi:hypothetical protein